MSKTISEHSDLEAAAPIVKDFRKGSSHNIERLTSASTALANMTAIFTASGFIRSETDHDSIVTAVLKAKNRAAGKSERSPELCEQDSNVLHDQTVVMLFQTVLKWQPHNTTKQLAICTTSTCLEHCLQQLTQQHAQPRDGIT